MIKLNCVFSFLSFFEKNSYLERKRSKKEKLTTAVEFDKLLMLIVD